MPLSLKSRRIGDIIAVACGGRIIEGTESASLQQHLSGLLPDSPHIVLDLSQVDFIDSGGLGLLVRFLSRARAAGGDLKLSGVPPRIAEVLRITRLRTSFDTYESEADAVSAFYRGASADGGPNRFDADILCVDTSADVLAYVCEVLRQAGYGVMPSATLPDALVLLKASRPRAVVIGAEVRAARDTWTSRTFNELAGGLPVVELPAGFAHSDAGQAGQGLLDEVRALIGTREAPIHRG